MNINRETKSMSYRIMENLSEIIPEKAEGETEGRSVYLTINQRIIILMNVSLHSFSLFLYSIFTESDFYSGSINNNESKINLHYHLQ